MISSVVENLFMTLSKDSQGRLDPLADGPGHDLAGGDPRPAGQALDQATDLRGPDAVLRGDDPLERHAHAPLGDGVGDTAGEPGGAARQDDLGIQFDADVFDRAHGLHDDWASPYASGGKHEKKD